MGGFNERMNISSGIWVLRFRSDGLAVKGSISIELIRSYSWEVIGYVGVTCASL